MSAGLCSTWGAEKRDETELGRKGSSPADEYTERVCLCVGVRCTWLNHVRRAIWWKDLTSPTVEEQMVKVMELAEMAKLTALVREKTLKFHAVWKPLLDFLRKTGKK